MGEKRRKIWSGLQGVYNLHEWTRLKHENGFAKKKGRTNSV